MTEITITMAEDSYSIKEMITEFREDTSKSFESVDKRLIAIELTGKIANGRTSKIEMWVKLVVGASIAVYAITMTIGGIFMRLYIQDIARNVTENTLQIEKNNIADQVVTQLEEKYNLDVK